MRKCDLNLTRKIEVIYFKIVNSQKHCHRNKISPMSCEMRCIMIATQLNGNEMISVDAIDSSPEQEIKERSSRVSLLSPSRKYSWENVNPGIPRL